MTAVSTTPSRRHRIALTAIALALAAALGLAACAGGTAAGSAPHGTAGSAGAGPPVAGGTAYFAQQPLTPPTYIFPLVS
ncbi:MAG TPA: hypothetical protein VHY31_28915, partial [Streptosporangiaceae bacterium]|nr:hypothetical protein [Streptosporangiaceae bacterium]